MISKEIRPIRFMSFITKFLKGNDVNWQRYDSKTIQRVAWLTVFILTAILFIALQSFFPFIQLITLDEPIAYAYLEDISIKLLVSLVLALLLVSTVMKYASLAMTLTLGAALGMVFFIIVLNLKMVDPTQINWLMRRDWQWHFMGWHFFRHEPWHFPLVGQINGILFPVGTSIGLTDSIPLFALLFKPFTALLPREFQYIGLWFLTCFTLQGVFAALLIRLRSQNLLIIAIGTLFFVLSPILLVRLNHAALCAHWLLLAGLWLYFRTWKTHPLWGWLIFISLSALIHPYLTAMMFGLVTAFYARLWLIDRRYTAISVLGQLVLLGLTTLFIWWVLGYFMVTSQSHMAGQTPLGYYSMNLLAPFNPMWWSLLLKNMPVVTEGQNEGFNYLGVGVLVMGIWAIYELSKRTVQVATFKKLLPLGVVCIGFTLFALSNKITMGDAVLIDFQSDLLNLFAPFQSSGRFFWPVNYTLLFLIISLLIVRNRLRTVIIYLSFALTIQVLDLHAIHQAIRHNHREASFYSWENPLQSSIWSELASIDSQHITLVPPSVCGEAAAPYLPFSRLAGRYDMTINSGVAARVDVEKIMQYCQTLFSDIQEGKVTNDTIYILHPNYLEAFKKATVPVVCVKIDGFDTCVTEASFKQWEESLGLSF